MTDDELVKSISSFTYEVSFDRVPRLCYVLRLSLYYSYDSRCLSECYQYFEILPFDILVCYTATCYCVYVTIEQDCNDDYYRFFSRRTIQESSIISVLDAISALNSNYDKLPLLTSYLEYCYDIERDDLAEEALSLFEDQSSMSPLRLVIEHVKPHHVVRAKKISSKVSYSQVLDLMPEDPTTLQCDLVVTLIPVIEDFGILYYYEESFQIKIVRALQRNCYHKDALWLKHYHHLVTTDV